MSTTRVEPLTCRGCGAALALPRGDDGTCDSCEAPFRLSAAHRALRDEAEQARRARREAEEAWRALPSPIPVWAADAMAAALLVLCALLTTASLIAWAFYGVFTSVRDMLVLGVLTPLFVLVWGMIEVVAAGSYARRVEALSALPPLEEERRPRCRVCGAPLALEPDALAATCDYCKTDSLVTRLSSRRRKRLDQSKREVARQLGEAVEDLAMRRGEQRLLRWITIVVLVGCWLGFWFALPH